MDSVSRKEIYAHIPQHFNLKVRVNGNIKGVNPKDTKLISTECTLQTFGDDATLTARRLRNDICNLETIDGDINIGSYVESGKLRI